MANILVLGVGPLPFEPADKLYAPGIRTWQITSVLAKKRHYITLCIIDFSDVSPGKNAGSSTAVRHDLGHNISLIRMSYALKETIDALRTLHLATRFAAVISTTDVMNGLVADLDLNVPTWLDYNGDPLAEKQQQARLYQHDGSLLPQWRLYLKGLLFADRFSVCSQAQRYAMIGQLAYAGRLTGKNSGEELVSVIPNCSRALSEKTPVRTNTLKGSLIPASAFLVLWSGGYNTWCDPETLFRGLESAMAKNPQIFFASTGGAIENHDTRSFEIFKELVDQSRFRDRFIFLGWVPTEEVGSFYEQADVAVLTDRQSVEGELGARTRMIDWIQYKVPILCTALCEFAGQMRDLNLIKSFPIGKSEAFATALLEMAIRPEESQIMAQKAREWFESEMEEHLLFEPLTRWAESPRFARDRITVVEHQGQQDAWLSNLAMIQLNASKSDAVSDKRKADGKAPAKSRLRNFFSRKN